MAINYGVEALLLKIDDYRLFLEQAFALLKSDNPNFSYNYFARKAGFASRSFPREVITGRKRLTEISLPKFIQGLNLSEDGSNCFTYLVQSEHPELNAEKLSASAIKNLLQRSRKRLESALDFEQKNLESINIFQIDEWPKIYACLHHQVGSTIEEVMKRTGLGRAFSLRALNGMLKEEMITYDPAAETYVVKVGHLFLEKSAKDQFFKRYFVNSLEKAKFIAQENFVDRKTCFFNSTFSVKASKMEELCDELRGVLNRYVDANEFEHGDSVVVLNVAFWNEILIDRKKETF